MRLIKVSIWLSIWQPGWAPLKSISNGIAQNSLKRYALPQQMSHHGANTRSRQSTSTHTQTHTPTCTAGHSQLHTHTNTYTYTRGNVNAPNLFAFCVCWQMQSFCYVVSFHTPSTPLPLIPLLFGPLAPNPITCKKFVYRRHTHTDTHTGCATWRMCNVCANIVSIWRWLHTCLVGFAQIESSQLMQMLPTTANPQPPPPTPPQSRTAPRSVSPWASTWK